jgi:Ser/Thr protein kinase RdoA (MazF antagonist)
MKELLNSFQIDGRFEKAEHFGSGLIHQTYLASFNLKEQKYRYIVQRVNHQVFTRPAEVMENIERVLSHLAAKYPDSENLELVPARDGNNWITDGKGHLWRVYPYIRNSKTVDIAISPAQAQEAARMFGAFFRALSDIEPTSLNISIPRFHDLAWRYAQLNEARKKDKANRMQYCRNELNECLSRKQLADQYDNALQSGELPRRVAHHDTKINNVLLDANTGKGLCVIDLDTVMPGTVVSDFGDMVRTMACTAGEEESDLTKVKFNLDMFRAIAEGFISETKPILSPGEVRWLPLAGPYLTLMQAIRYLSDYLNGDEYYKTKHPEHNLIRCRNQLTYLLELEKQSAQMEVFIH